MEVKPKDTDIAQKKRDDFWGVLYVDQFPGVDSIDPLTRIVYLNGNTWRSRRTAEQQSLELQIPPPSYEEYLTEAKIDDAEDLYADLLHRWQKCLENLDPDCSEAIIEEAIRWQENPVELRKNPLFVKMNQPRRKNHSIERVFEWIPSHFSVQRLREAHEVESLHPPASASIERNARLFSAEDDIGLRAFWEMGGLALD
jgi:hypothetical protein